MKNCWACLSKLKLTWQQVKRWPQFYISLIIYKQQIILNRQVVKEILNLEYLTNLIGLYSFLIHNSATKLFSEMQFHRMLTRIILRKKDFQKNLIIKVSLKLKKEHLHSVLQLLTICLIIYLKTPRKCIKLRAVPKNARKLFFHFIFISLPQLCASLGMPSETL